MSEVQEQFDWQQETAKCVEGVKFDLDQDYKFDLIFEEVALHALKTKDGTILTYKKGNREGQPMKMFCFPFREQESGIAFKLEFFQNDSYRVNPGNPELEDEIVKFSRKLGYNPVLDGNFSPKDFIHPGISITARLKEIPLTDEQKKAGKKVYKTIDIETIRCDSAGEVQEQIEKVSEADRAAVLDLAKGCKKFSELTTKINKAKKFDLLDAAMRMKEQGILKI